MKQLLLAIPLLFIIFLSAPAQTATADASLSEKQWNDLVSALEKEDWIAAEKLSWDYFVLAKTDDEAKTLGRLRYMYLYSAAGKVAAGKMSYEELEKRIKDFAGNEIVFPYRPVKKECRAGFDSNTVCKGNDAKRFFITGTNHDITTIHDFEYIQLKEDFDFEKNDGKLAMIIGRIDSVAPNPNRSLVLILRIYVSDACVKLRDMPPEK